MKTAIDLTDKFKRIHLLVQGIVQGVGYRYFVVRMANKFKLTGWVRNLPDGTVEIEVQGMPPEIKQFIYEIQTNHPGAKVNEIQQTDIPVKLNSIEFKLEF